MENRIINHLKVQLDGIVRNDSVFIFAETNRPDLVNKVCATFFSLFMLIN